MRKLIVSLIVLAVIVLAVPVVQAQTCLPERPPFTCNFNCHSALIAFEVALSADPVVYVIESRNDVCGHCGADPDNQIPCGYATAAEAQACVTYWGLVGAVPRYTGELRVQRYGRFVGGIAAGPERPPPTLDDFLKPSNSER